ncbi:unnamed protein product [Closterium sp. Naga37s-1]|nr:unnamed protein product [Closterium sp. Naga37s-1]
MGEGEVVLHGRDGGLELENVLLVEDLKWERYADGVYNDGFYEMNLIACNDMDTVYDDDEFYKVQVKGSSFLEVGEVDDKGDVTSCVKKDVVKNVEDVLIKEKDVRVEKTVKPNEVICVNNAATFIIEDQAVCKENEGVEAAKGSYVVKAMVENAATTEGVLKEGARVGGNNVQKVYDVKRPRRSARLQSLYRGLDVKAVHLKTRKQRFKKKELQGSVNLT